MIPQFDLSEVLPPFTGGDPTKPANMSPYSAQMTEVVERFCTSADRKAILSGLLRYRTDLMSAGIISGFQWLDGSFVENIEASENRAPGDVDVVTFFDRPVGDSREWRDWWADNAHLFNPRATKTTYKCDVYGVDLNTAPENIVNQTRYWFGLFSHRRHRGPWKGMIQVALDATDDAKAEALLKDLMP
jgi:hypothetical protein